MLKLLPIVLILIAVGGFVYIKFFSSPKPPLESSIQALEIGSGTNEERIRNLEIALVTLAKQVGNIDSKVEGSAEKSQLETIQGTLSDLKEKISPATDGEASPEPSPTPSGKSPLYIPLGWNGGASSTEWSSISTQSIIIDTSQYPGYTSMQFEASIRVYQGNGRAHARIFNKDDGEGYLSSEISTSSDNYTWVSSEQFNIAGSKKTYVLQLKSLTGYEASVQNARLKVNF